MRYHADRTSVLWDSLDPAWLDRAVQWLDRSGLEPFIVVERWEEPRFRDRFDGQSSLGALDWPPRFEIDRQVRIFALPIAPPIWRGVPVPTEYVVPR